MGTRSEEEEEAEQHESLPSTASSGSRPRWAPLTVPRARHVLALGRGRAFWEPFAPVLERERARGAAEARVLLAPPAVAMLDCDADGSCSCSSSCSSSSDGEGS